MSIANGQHAWPPPVGHQVNGSRVHQQVDDGPARTQTPVDASVMLMPEASDLEEESLRAHFSDLYRKSEAKISRLFREDGSYDYKAIGEFLQPPRAILPPTTDHAPIAEPPHKKVKRAINEDDYDDDDEEDDQGPDSQASATKEKNAAAASTLLSPSKSGSSPVHSVTSPPKPSDKPKEEGAQGEPKSAEDARKQLEAVRTATEENVKRTFHTLFYTLENDRTAMVEQQKLEESERQLQAEMEKNSANNTSNGNSGENHSSLSSANLGASSLTLKHLLARIDMKRDRVRASDAELRTLINEVKKNRSRWANEENVNQEELYEALEKVLTELKAHTEFSTPFLQRVNKRDAPDYYNLIKNPMDLGTMTKKLKNLAYKSKTEFVTDLNLIWDNCLKYNTEMTHPLRRLANNMRKEAEKLIPLIPDLVIRPRAEVEAEERRKQNGGEDDGGDDSDDEPIMSSRGRKAGTKGAAKSRKTHAEVKEGTPSVDQKPVLQLNGLLAKGREGSEVMDGSNGFATPPVGGSITPSGPHGQTSNADMMDVDGPSINGMSLGQALSDAAEQQYEAEEDKIWKQLTKKDRALVTRERFQLFKGVKLDIDQPALLRDKAKMRRFTRSRQKAEASGLIPGQASGGPTTEAIGETLAEGMDAGEERVIPDYYEPLGIIPDVASNLRWIEDDEGQVINNQEEFLRLVPRGQFVSPVSSLSAKIDANIKQMQDTRKVCSRIAMVKQMQVQNQVYANQFPKFNPAPIVEADIEPHFICGAGPVIAPEVCRSALQRSVAKIFYMAGFEELQPSALDVITDVAADYFKKLVYTLKVYSEAEKKPATGAAREQGKRFVPRFTTEEILLHTLNQNGQSVAELESYAKDDVERLSHKLTGIHERMKSHLTELLRPALVDAGPDGAGAFNDGSEQFVGGDFAEDVGEDFFGFRALGLDKELGLEMLSVPLHLLQSRVRNAYQSNTETNGMAITSLFEDLPLLEPVTRESIEGEIGIVKNFFLSKLHANGDQPLVEDEDLPVKQRRPRPRLGATGKIVSPQKRPPKEQIALAKKKKKLESGLAQITDGALKSANATPEKPAAAKKKASITAGVNGVVPVIAPPMERIESVQSPGGTSQTDREEANGMMSPESLER